MKKIISISMEEKMYKEIKEKANNLGLTVSAYIVLNLKMNNGKKNERI